MKPLMEQYLYPTALGYGYHLLLNQPLYLQIVEHGWQVSPLMILLKSQPTMGGAVVAVISEVASHIGLLNIGLVNLAWQRWQLIYPT